MEFKPTESQQAAIDAKGTVLVSAAAGSGKTKVLVERVIKMLTDRENPVMADRLLIVTFTNAAAGEMLSRIESRLYEEYEKNPDDELINRQKYLIKSADICTIDSFCIRIVRDNFALCDIEPDFKVANYNALALIRREVLSDLINRQLQNPGETFKKLLKITNCKFDESNLFKVIDDLYSKVTVMPFPKRHIDLLKKPYTVPFAAGNPWYDAAFDTAREKIAAAQKSAGRFAEEAQILGNVKVNEYAQTLAAVIYTVYEAVGSGDWDKVFECAASASLPNVPKNVTPDLLKALKASASSNLKYIKDMFYAKREDVENEIAGYADAAVLLCDLLNGYSDELLKRLKEENIFSFGDIEQMATNLLCDIDSDGNITCSERGAELISRYDEVLVDEFQDVNDLQNTLFEFLSDNSKKLFVVGDVKQSIYGFRGSNPDIFLKKKNAYGDYSTGGNETGKRITLSHNFRSRKGICDAVNYFFENIMTGDVGSLTYGEAEKLNPKVNYPENGETETDFLLIDTAGDDSEDSIIEIEAKAIAEYVKSLVSKKILSDKNGGLRPVEYGDICILMPSIQEKGVAVADVLTKYGIPAVVSRGGFLESTEVITALSLLAVINNPQNDVELLKVMMSPVYGFTAADLAEMRVNRKDMSLYSALRLYAAESEKAKAFLDELSELRRMSCMLPIDRFVSFALDKTDMVNTFYSMPGGSIRAQNLMRLMQLSGEYSSGGSGSVFGFLKYVMSAGDDSSKTADSAGDSVRIMSIHRSKGLQFPVCIVAGLSIRKNNADTAPPCLYSRNYGIAFKYFDKDALESKENFGCGIIKKEINDEKVRERLRLLYVAMTRAEEKLCVVCCMKNAAAVLEKAADASDTGKEAIKGNYIISSSSSANYMLAAAILHPDADELRKVIGEDITLRKTESRINFRFINSAEIEIDEAAERVSEPDETLAEKLDGNIKYAYPFAALADIPAKAAVTALSNREETEAFAMTQRPSFMQKDGLSAAGRGTATHKVMQFIDFSESPDIDAEIEKLVFENRISENEAAAVDRRQIKNFFDSPLYRRIISSGTVRREMRFLTELPVSMYGEGAKDLKDKFIVQGAVDLCFLEPDGVVVVDFKTDRVDSMSELKKRYAAQLGIYSVACEKIFGKSVKERIIYSFSLSDEITV